jgi:hypothetical protein
MAGCYLDQTTIRCEVQGYRPNIEKTHVTLQTQKSASSEAAPIAAKASPRVSQSLRLQSPAAPRR